MSDSLLKLMTGDDFYYYLCSVCKKEIVTIRIHKEPTQCSENCKKEYEKLYE